MRTKLIHNLRSTKLDKFIQVKKRNKDEDTLPDHQTLANNTAMMQCQCLLKEAHKRMDLTTSCYRRSIDINYCLVVPKKAEMHL